MIIVAFVVGVLVGTAIAVLLERFYTGAPWRGPILPCPKCGQPAPRVAWLDMPGWLALRGHCPHCRGALSVRLLYLPLLGGAAFGVTAMQAEGRQFWLALLFAMPLLALTATDFKRRLLPNRIMYPTLVAATLLCWAWPDRDVVGVLLGGVAGFGIMLLLFLVLPGFGFGDVKLAGLLGLLSGLPNLLPALTIGAVSAAAGSLILLALGRTRLHGLVAYGPYLALGAFWGMLAGG
jgi:leader peptidase (prepilin peptidase)/N-methyltransferase